MQYSYCDLRNFDSVNQALDTGTHACIADFFI